jgi:hypothetical protein
MKTLLAATLFSMFTAASAFAQAPSSDCTEPCTTAPVEAPPAALPQPASAPTPASKPDDDGWHQPAGQRFASGFRFGAMYIANYDKPNRLESDGTMKSIKDELGLKTPYMFLLGYEGFYRVIGHSWLNVLMVGNLSVAGLEQSKFVPVGSGLLGFEFDRSFEVGVGINLVPDTKSPSHVIVAAGWTPRIGSIQTPIHVFYVPDADGNSRSGATIGMNW